MIYNSDLRFFKKAATLALSGEHRVRVGCLAVCKGKPVAGAWNTIRNTSPVKFKDMTIHAEMACLNQVSYRLHSSTYLYVARISKANELLPSYPCAKCMKKLMKTDLKGIYFFDESGRITKETL